MRGYADGSKEEEIEEGGGGWGVCQGGQWLGCAKFIVCVLLTHTIVAKANVLLSRERSPDGLNNGEPPYSTSNTEKGRNNNLLC